MHYLTDNTVQEWKEVVNKQIEKSEDENYKENIKEILAALQIERTYGILVKKGLSLTVKKIETGKKIIDIFTKAMNEQEIFTYFSSLLDKKRINATNIPAILKGENKDFPINNISILLEAIGEDMWQEDDTQRKSFLHIALLDPQTEKIILDTALKIRKESVIYSAIIHGYLDNKEINKAVKLYKKESPKWKDNQRDELKPSDFLERLTILGAIDQAKEYLTENNSFRKRCKKELEYDNKAAHKLIDTIINNDIQEAIHFLTNPIKKIWEEEHIKYFIEKIKGTDTDNTIIFACLTADTNNIAYEVMNYVVENYTEAFVKKVFDHNDGELGKKIYKSIGKGTTYNPKASGRELKKQWEKMYFEATRDPTFDG